MRALICDDEFTARVMLLRTAERVAQCDIATDGLEAVEAFEAGLRMGRPYDLVCLDLGMPRLSGHEALEAIRLIEQRFNVRQRDAARVIMVTASNTRGDILQSFRDQANGYLVKPLKPSALYELLIKFGLIAEAPTRH